MGAGPPMSTPVDRRLDPPTWDAADLSRPARIRATLLAVLSGVALVAYLWWILQPGRAGNPWLFGILIAAEIFNMVQAIGLWYTCLTRRPRRAPAPTVQWPPSDKPFAVDVFIPTY